MPTLNRTGIGLGDFVRTATHGYRGRVTEVHFGCPQDSDWVAAQAVPIRAEALDGLHVWFSILVHEGGAVVAPAYDVERVERFDLDNDWAREYWPADYREPRP